MFIEFFLPILYFLHMLLIDVATSPKQYKLMRKLRGLILILNHAKMADIALEISGI